MFTKEEVLQKLAIAKKELVKKYPIATLGLFGSYAREEQTENSDIDILIDFHAPIGWEIGSLANELDAILGKRVDVLTFKGIENKKIASYIFEDLIHCKQSYKHFI